jgi:hypothetical protein
MAGGRGHQALAAVCDRPSVQFLAGKPAAEPPATVAGHDGGEQAGLEQPPGPRPVRPRAKRQIGGHQR